MPERDPLFFFPMFLPFIVAIISLWLQSSNRMHLEFPINSKHAKHARELIENKRLHASIEEFPASLEIIKNVNLNAYIDLLLDQHKNSDKSMREYIARIPFTEQGQHFFRSVSVGWHNSFSITLIAHKKYDGYHKILIARLSKEVTVSLLYRILSPIASIFGMTISEQKQMEAIITNVNHGENKQIMENMMMFVMADNLHNRFNNDVEIDFVQK
jgi:hypothetical protein